MLALLARGVEVGLVGKPNVGKSTFFSAATLAPAQIADYPFTTIEPNRGVAYVRAKCPHTDLGKPCNPNHGACEDGTRLVPVEVLDVAGLVPKAHEGRGLGNKFLDDLRQATAFVHIVDASGRTDFEGNAVKDGTHDPTEDVRFLEDELAHWIYGIIERDFEKNARRAELEEVPIERIVHERVTGLGLSEAQVVLAVREAGLPVRPSTSKKADLLRLADLLRRKGKPMVLAANKADLAPPANLEKLRALAGYLVVPTAAEFELALRRAAKADLIAYLPG
ncbi:MAG: redox-regulated ATPase YchF, partial [Methanobacteriota archaeon]